MADAFVVRFRSDGFKQWATYLGGSGRDGAEGVAISPMGETTVTGLTYSLDFPIVDAIQDRLRARGLPAWLLSRRPVSNLVLTFSTHLGGGSSDQAYGVAVDPGGSFLWVSGLTRSVDFPTLKPWQPVLAGEGDVFVTKIVLGAPGKTSPK